MKPKELHVKQPKNENPKPLRQRRAEAKQALLTWFNRLGHQTDSKLDDRVVAQFRRDHPDTEHTPTDLKYGLSKLRKEGKVVCRFSGLQATMGSTKRQADRRQPVRLANGAQAG